MNRKYRLVAVLIAIAVSCYLYWPHAIFLVSKLRSGSVGIRNLEIRMANGWFVAYTSDSWLAKELLSFQGPPTAFLFKVDGVKPGLSSSMSISTLKPEEGKLPPDMVCGTLKYNWGHVVKVCREGAKDQLYLVLASNIGIVTMDHNALDEIRDLTLKLH